jgi:hypothetical protein
MLYHERHLVLVGALTGCSFFGSNGPLRSRRPRRSRAPCDLKVEGSVSGTKGLIFFGVASDPSGGAWLVGARHQGSNLGPASPCTPTGAQRASRSSCTAHGQSSSTSSIAETDHRPADALLIRPDAHIAWAATIDEPADTAARAARSALRPVRHTPEHDRAHHRSALLIGRPNKRRYGSSSARGPSW